MKRSAIIAGWRVELWLAWLAPPSLILLSVGLGFLWLADGHPSRIAYVAVQEGWFLEMNRALSAAPHVLWSTLARLGDTTVLLPLVFLVIIPRPRVLVSILVTGPVALLLGDSAKLVAAVPRPAATLDPETFTTVGRVLTGHNSLPSGHSITYAAAAVAILAVVVPSPRTWRHWLLFLATFSIVALGCLDRVAVGAHWPLDVLVGCAIGWLAGLVGAAVARRSTWRWQETRARRVVGVLLLALSLSRVAGVLDPIQHPVAWVSDICGVLAALWLLTTRQAEQPRQRSARTPFLASRLVGRRAVRSSFRRMVNGPMSATRFSVIVAAANTVVYHQPLYGWAVNDLDLTSFGSILALATLPVVMFLAAAAGLLLLFSLAHRIVKPVCALVALGNSVALYFMTTYGVILDKSMMGNVRETNTAEALELVHPRLLLYVLLFAVLPIAWMSRVKVQRVARLRLAGLAAAATLLIGVWGLLASGTWLWIDENSKRLGGMTLPWSYFGGLARVEAETMTRRETVLLPPATFTSDEKKVVVLVIGETARAQNFSLYGYDRTTDLRLVEAGAVALRNSVACATYTTASVRCMLSHTDATSFLSTQYEPLPSYLQRQGVDVIWRTNNWGEPPLEVASYERAEALRQDCVGTGCDFDEVLLRGLKDRIASSQERRVFVVLQLKGSHGPSYYTRYPPRFERFMPVCRSVELHECTTEELVNAYDNTIWYTDYVLAQVIEVLDSLEERPAIMMYMSDHGESLGEHRLYLHGVPYSMAPDVQKRVPFLVWASKQSSDEDRIGMSHLNQRESYSSRNIFHSVMGAFGMRSEIYDERLDIFSDPRDDPIPAGKR